MWEAEGPLYEILGPVFQFSDFSLGIGEYLHVYNELSLGWDTSWAVRVSPLL